MLQGILHPVGAVFHAHNTRVTNRVGSSRTGNITVCPIIAGLKNSTCGQDQSKEKYFFHF